MVSGVSIPNYQHGWPAPRAVCKTPSNFHTTASAGPLEPVPATLRGAPHPARTMPSSVDDICSSGGGGGVRLARGAPRQPAWLSDYTPSKKKVEFNPENDEVRLYRVSQTGTSSGCAGSGGSGRGSGGRGLVIPAQLSVVAASVAVGSSLELESPIHSWHLEDARYRHELRV